MPTDHSGEPWSKTTYRGFSGPSPQAEPRPRRWPRLLAIGGGVAVALGLVLGIALRPQISGEDKAERAAAPVPIEVNQPPPPQPVRSAGKLEVLPPDQVAAARAAAPTASAAVPTSVSAPETQARAASEPAVPPPAPSVRAAPQPLATPTVASVESTGRTDCAGAGGLAAQMVCEDPALTATDRELNRAYRRALRSGTAPGALRADQRDWLAIREDAAHRSRHALESVYRQRIEELNALAENPGAEDDDSPGF